MSGFLHLTTEEEQRKVTFGGVPYKPKLGKTEKTVCLWVKRELTLIQKFSII